MTDSELREIAEEYARYRGIEIHKFLGGGTDGSVWLSNRKTAVKALQRQKNYTTELACYQRLSDHGITKIHQFRLPRLIGFDDALKVIEISTVAPPCMFDFGKAYLDWEPQHTPEVIEDYHNQQRERFGENFNEVQALLWKLKQIGIYYVDPTPGNIRFLEEDKAGD